MYLVAITPADEALLKEQVDSVVEQFKGDVIRIRYDVGFDIDHNAEVNFRILLSDKVAKRKAKLLDVAFGVEDRLFDHIRVGNSGLIPSFEFRTSSEQDEFQDPEWD